MTRRVRAVAVISFVVSSLLCTGAWADERESRRHRSHRHHRQDQEGAEESARDKDESPAAVDDPASKPPESGALAIAAKQPSEGVPDPAQGALALTSLAALIDGKVEDPLALPEATLPELESLGEERLKQFNGHVENVHDAVQTGERCESLRLASRLPFRTWILREHKRELMVAAGLLILSLLGLAWRSRLLRAIMPLPPVLGCLYLGYASVEDTSAVLDSLLHGLHACSASLSEGSGANPLIVKKRLDEVQRMRSTVDEAYEPHAESIEALLEKYKM